MKQIIPGIYQLEVPIPNNPLGRTNVYLLKGDGGHLLIDTGWEAEESFVSLKNQIAETGAELKDISHLVFTHGHGDHYGLASKMRDITHAKIFLHHLDQEHMKERLTNTDAFIREVQQLLHMNGVPTEELPDSIFKTARGKIRGYVPPTVPDVILHGGETISNGKFSLQVIWTPGHSPGHVCFYELTQQLLFAGDHILPNITPHISVQSLSDNNPLGDFLQSLNSLKQLSVKLVLPAHEHLFTNLPKRIDEIIEHHRQRTSEITEALKIEPKTAYQVSSGITWMPDLGGVRFESLARGEKQSAVTETLAHLEAMRVDGRATKFPDNSSIYYRLA